MSWQGLVRSGYSWIHVVQIEGIPHIFCEAVPPRVDSTSTPTLPPGYTSAVECLLVGEGDSVAIEVDRQSGVASGAAYDVTLTWQGLEDNALTSALFSLPGASMMLDEDVGTGTGSVLVTDTTGWSAANAWIGTERVALTVVDGTHVDLTTRGLAGSMAGTYKRQSPTMKHVTDKPVTWRGRHVTLWRHLVSPDGRVLNDEWCDTGTLTKHCRVIWRGYVDSPPRPTGPGMVLRCLPLIRKAAQPIGHDVEAVCYEAGPEPDYAPEAIAGLPVYAAPGSVLFNWVWASSATVSGTCTVKPSHPDGVFTLGQIAHACMVDAYSSSVTDPIWSTVDASSVSDALNVGDGVRWGALPAPLPGAGGVAGLPYISLRFMTYSTALSSSQSFIHVPAGGPYFLRPGIYQPQYNASTGGGGYTINDAFFEFRIPVRMPSVHPATLPGFWLPVVQTEGQEWADVQFPGSGYGVIESDEGKAVIQWDAKVDGSFANVDVPSLVLLRVSVVHVAGGFIFWNTGATVGYITGKSGSVAEVLLTLLESSGSGNRGSYDTLALGQGAGVDDSLIDANSLSAAGLAGHVMHLFSAGAASIADLLGGHLALRGLCLVQRMTHPDVQAPGAATTGDVNLAAVPIDVGVADAAAVTISIGEAVLEAVGAPEPAESPNAITVETQTELMSDPVSLTVNDVPRIQVEGPHTAGYKAPGMALDEARQLAVAIMRRGNGESILTIQVGPWVEVQPGDLVNLTMAHPVTYDFKTAARAPASVGARCLGWSADLYSGTQTLTLLLAGNMLAAGPLCPSVGISSVDSTTTVTVDNLFDVLDRLVVADVVLLHTPGDEQDATTPKSAEATIQALADITDANPRLVTFTAALPAWVDTSTVITYPVLASCTTRQAAYVHNDTGSELV